MKSLDRLAAARDQLNRTLSFFPRVDGKASIVLAIDTSMLALLATRALPYTELKWEWIPIGLTLLPLGISFFYLYRQAFPTLEGGHSSLIYFREIARRTETKYIEEWKWLTEDDYYADLLSQVWRNSQILKAKFDHLKIALMCLAISIPFWLVALALLSWRAAVSAN